MSLKLPEGHFYGRIAKSIKLNGLILTEAVYSPGFTTPKHSHEQAYFCLVLKGSSSQAYAAKNRILKPFSTYFYPPGEVHSESYDNAGHEFIIQMASTWISRLREHAPIPDHSVDFQGSLPAWLAMRLYHEFRQMDSMSPVAIEGLALELFAEVSRRSRHKAGRKPPRWLDQARELVQGHFSEPLSLADVATAVGVHPVHLAREFRRWHRCTVGEYIRRLRIDFARQAIATTNLPLGRIGFEAGFSEPSHFTRTFKRLTGITPAEFRATFSPNCR
jgi:AraC family transcriptional regulator